MKTLYRTFDIECTPAVVRMYGKWFNPYVVEELEPEMIISVSWCDNGGDPKFKAVWDMPAYKGKWNLKAQKEFTVFLRDLIHEPDVLVGQNSDDFDIKKVNTSCMMFKINPPRKNVSYDTKKLAGKYGYEPTKKLAYIGPKYTENGKITHEGVELYIKARAGDKKAQKELEAYNKMDAVITRDLFFGTYYPFIVREEVKTENKKQCPFCGGHDTQRRGTAPYSGSIHRRYQCLTCAVTNEKSWFYGEKSINKPSYAHHSTTG